MWTCCSKENLTTVLSLQKRAARVIFDTPKLTSSVELFNRLRWLPFYEEVKVSECLLALKHLHGDIAPYISEALKLNCEIHTKSTRYAKLNFICPKF